MWSPQKPMSKKSLLSIATIFYPTTEHDKVNIVCTKIRLRRRSVFQSLDHFLNKIISTNLSVFKCEHWQTSGLVLLCFLALSQQPEVTCKGRRFARAVITNCHTGWLQPQRFIFSLARGLETADQCGRKVRSLWGLRLAAFSPCLPGSSFCVSRRPNELSCVGTPSHRFRAHPSASF